MTRRRGGARRAVGWAGGALRSRDRPPHTTACPRRTRLSGRRAGGLAGVSRWRVGGGLSLGNSAERVTGRWWMAHVGGGGVIPLSLAWPPPPASPPPLHPSTSLGRRMAQTRQGRSAPAVTAVSGASGCRDGIIPCLPSPRRPQRARAGSGAFGGEGGPGSPLHRRPSRPCPHTPLRQRVGPTRQAGRRPTPSLSASPPTPPSLHHLDQRSRGNGDTGRTVVERGAWGRLARGGVVPRQGARRTRAGTTRGAAAVRRASLANAGEEGRPPPPPAVRHPSSWWR